MSFALTGARRSLRSLALVAALPLVPSLMSAQALPSAKDLIAKYVAAIGGENAWKGHTSLRSKATIDMPSAGISMTMESVQKVAGQTAMTMEIPGMGQMRSGYDGTIAWATSPMTGPRVLDGKELAAARDDADPKNFLRLSANIASSETVEKTTLGGVECYKVKHTWKSGRVTQDCFSTKDALIVAQMMTQTSPMGEAEVTMLLSDYKDFGGIKRPTKVTAEAMGQQQIVTFTGFEWDNATDKDFEIPADVKPLIKKP